MFRYADPTTCPVCRATMAHGALECPECRTRLTGPLAQSLFRTLTDADGLVAQLAALSANATAARTTPAAPGVPVGAGTGAHPAAGSGQSMLPPDLPAFPAGGVAPTHGPTWGPSRSSGLSAASVPKILLGLGALCLLVAAIVFLAVAWSLLGVGGRTAVLILLTVAAGGLGWLSARRGLRAGAESFLTVALGLLTLDVFGADSAGWLGFLDETGFQTLLGATLAVAGLGSALLLRRCPTGSLVSTQLVGGFGLAFGLAGLVESVHSLGPQNMDTTAVSAVVWMVLLVGALVGTRALALPVASVVVLVGIGLGWLELVVAGFVRIDEPSFAGVWAGLHPWPAVLAALMAGALAWFGRSLPLVARVVAAAVAVALLSLLAVIPAFDESLNSLTLVASVTVALAAVASHVLPRPWRPIVAAPSLAAACGLLVPAAILGSGALTSLFFTDPWSVGAGTALPDAELSGLWPALTPLVVAGLLAGGWTMARLAGDVPATELAVPAVLVVAASAVAVPTAYGVGLGVMVVLLLVCAAALTGAGVATGGHTRLTALVLAGVLAGAALLASVQSQPLTALTTGLLALASVAATLVTQRSARFLGDIVFAPAVGVFLWTTLDLAGVDAPWRAVPLLVVLGAWAVLGARPEREVPVAVAMLATVGLCVAGAGDSAQAWLAVDLTLAGVLAHLSALLNNHRRWLGWVGLGLMVLAQWVRLEEIGVDTVEAYTLPLAVVLLVVGVVRMRDAAVRSVRALGPGLTLALVPSLVVALAEPVSWRALLLGVACLAVTVAGAGLRWSAPLVAGATVGAVLALREVTHAVTLPQWLVIGLIGVVLTVVGVTWERSLQEVRRATGFLRRLR